MPNTTGDITKTTFLKGIESMKVREEFEVEALIQILTFDAALVASNDVDGDINETSLATTTFATDSDTTMAAVATLIAAHPDVKSAVVVLVGAGTDNDRVINITPIDQVNGVRLANFLVTSGASQAAIVITLTDNTIWPGQPVKLTSDGKVQPLASADNTELVLIGVSIHKAIGEELATIGLRGYSIIFAEAADALVAGPVKWTAFNKPTLRNRFSDDSVDETDMAGWAIDDAASAGDEIRVIVRS